MKLKNILVIVLLTTGLLSCSKMSQTETATTSQTQTENQTIATIKGLNKDLNGKYPDDVKLFDNKELASRLRKVMGEENYMLFRKMKLVEMPIACNDTLLYVSVCKQHDCSENYLNLKYDLRTGKISCEFSHDSKVDICNE